VQLVSTIESRESILLYGGPASGKSRAVLSIARKCPNSQVHIVDNDYAYERLLETEFDDVQNVTVYEVDSEDWKEQLDTAAKAKEECGRDDWFAFDMATETWQAVQSWFTQKVYGMDHADYFMQLRMNKDAKSKQNVELVQDDRWTVINNEYKKLQRLWLPSKKCHVICTAEAATLSPFDVGDTKKTFGEYQFKPKGQKRTGHLFSTVILMEKKRVGSWMMTTVKDRGRAEVEQKEVTDFAMDYLMKVAKWRPTQS